MSEVDGARLKARLVIVEEHVKCENRHDLAGLMMRAFLRRSQEGSRRELR
jgi:hypothetical protein